MYYTPGHFCKKCSGCEEHHYSYHSAQFAENYTVVQFVENYTLVQFDSNDLLEAFEKHIHWLHSDCDGIYMAPATLQTWRYQHSFPGNETCGGIASVSCCLSVAKRQPQMFSRLRENVLACYFSNVVICDETIL